MLLKLFVPTILLFLVIGCKKRTADDYHYYKPYQKVAPAVEHNDSVLNADTIPVNTLSKPPVAKYASKGVNLNESYFIVVASYVVQDYAIAQKERLQQQGFKPEIFMLNDDGWYKLTVQSYKTLAEAEAGLKLMIDNNVVAPDARIVFKKNKP